MLPFAHVGFAAFLSLLIALPSLFAAFGAIFPDIMDKVLFIIGEAPCGRFIAHTILFIPIAGVIIYLITERKEFALAFVFGGLLHLGMDSVDPLPLLYPFINYEFYCPPKSFGISTIEIAVEIIGALLLAVAMLYGSKLGNLKKTFRKASNFSI